MVHLLEFGVPQFQLVNPAQVQGVPQQQQVQEAPQQQQQAARKKRPAPEADCHPRPKKAARGDPLKDIPQECQPLSFQYTGFVSGRTPKGRLAKGKTHHLCPNCATNFGERKSNAQRHYLNGKCKARSRAAFRNLVAGRTYRVSAYLKRKFNMDNLIELDEAAEGLDPMHAIHVPDHLKEGARDKANMTEEAANQPQDPIIVTPDENGAFSIPDF